MSTSPRPRGGNTQHLDLTGDREVVFCHLCHHEWYNDEHPGLHCPSCDGDFCEIITPDNDPRDIPPSSSERGGEFPDPDEDDIDAAFLQNGPRWPPNRDQTGGQGGQGRRPGPVDPSSEQEIFSRFQETLNMLMGFGGPLGPAGRSNRDALGGGPAGIQTRTYRSPGGRATFSITTTTGPTVRMPTNLHGHGHEHQHDDFDMYGHPLQRRPVPGTPEVAFIAAGSNADQRPRIFGNAMGGGGIRPPQTGHPGLEGNLQGLFSILFGPGMMNVDAVHGDAVYSQEALDRIITQLMEANPQSNAAPPATEEAIENLQKKKLDKEMMGESNKVECTICIDEMQIGDEVTVLPCKHWFHGECVTLWLKEHNTCPICRAPIEKRAGIGENGDAGSSGGNNQRRASGGGNPSSPPRFGGWFSGGGGNPWDGGGGANSAPSVGQSTSYQTRGGRTDEERQRRLNAIRNLAGPSSYGQPQPESPRNRRDSWSPVSPPPGASSARDRSPPRPRPDRASSSSWSSQRSGQSSQNSLGTGRTSANPMNWLRGRFGGGGSGSNNGSNDGQSRRRS